MSARPDGPRSCGASGLAERGLEEAHALLDLVLRHGLPPEVLRVALLVPIDRLPPLWVPAAARPVRQPQNLPKAEVVNEACLLIHEREPPTVLDLRAPVGQRPQRRRLPRIVQATLPDELPLLAQLVEPAHGKGLGLRVGALQDVQELPGLLAQRGLLLDDVVDVRRHVARRLVRPRRGLNPSDAAVRNPPPPSVQAAQHHVAEGRAVAADGGVHVGPDVGVVGPLGGAAGVGGEPRVEIPAGEVKPPGRRHAIVRQHGLVVRRRPVHGIPRGPRAVAALVEALPPRLEDVLGCGLP
mmetsp:Transcript_96464/g.287895  ORF Transcript_96464/g.287895 Transcript_96464/m.287895 type:complete len:297 (+) Transcript_96464:91-981(+)